eukprot:2198964-Pyramimonas_sp.AAC.1
MASPRGRLRDCDRGRRRRRTRGIFNRRGRCSSGDGALAGPSGHGVPGRFHGDGGRCQGVPGRRRGAWQREGAVVSRGRRGCDHEVA